MFNLIEQLFAPGRRHTEEEKKRLELTRVDADAADPGKGPIDLASGHVVIRVPGRRGGSEGRGVDGLRACGRVS